MPAARARLSNHRQCCVQMRESDVFVRDRSCSHSAGSFGKSPPAKAGVLGDFGSMRLINTLSFRAIAGAFVLLDGLRNCYPLSDVPCMFVASLFQGSYFF